MPKAHRSHQIIRSSAKMDRSIPTEVSETNSNAVRRGPMDSFSDVEKKRPLARPDTLPEAPGSNGVAIAASHSQSIDETEQSQLEVAILGRAAFNCGS